jgi:D-alanyl-D-alanine endopeptidase (penicillin-binding protein 7)
MIFGIFGRLSTSPRGCRLLSLSVTLIRVSFPALLLLAVLPGAAAASAAGEGRVSVTYSKGKLVEKTQRPAPKVATPRKEQSGAPAGKAKPKAVAAVAPAEPVNPADPGVKSSAALVIDQSSGQVIYGKNAEAVLPIASITKVMTAMVVLDAQLPLDETLAIDAADIDTVKNTRSKLLVGQQLTRADLLKLALMSSENRAAAALARTYPGGTVAFVESMNRKAFALGMSHTRFVDSVGTHHENVSTASDVVRMVTAAYDYELVREYTTMAQSAVELRPSGRHILYGNSNGLVRSPGWDIGFSKTGYIAEAGRCLAMQLSIASRPVIMVLLDSWGKYTRIADATRIRRWVEAGHGGAPRLSRPPILPATESPAG